LRIIRDEEQSKNRFRKMVRIDEIIGSSRKQPAAESTQPDPTAALSTLTAPSLISTEDLPTPPITPKTIAARFNRKINEVTMRVTAA
jgi:hypothetical protein